MDKCSSRFDTWPLTVSVVRRRSSWGIWRCRGVALSSFLSKCAVYLKHYLIPSDAINRILLIINLKTSFQMYIGTFYYQIHFIIFGLTILIYSLRIYLNCLRGIPLIDYLATISHTHTYARSNYACTLPYHLRPIITHL